MYRVHKRNSFRVIVFQTSLTARKFILSKLAATLIFRREGKHSKIGGVRNGTVEYTRTVRGY